MAEWERDDSGLSIRDIEKREPYKLEPHHFANVKRLPWLRCKRCGLLTLRSDHCPWAWSTRDVRWDGLGYYIASLPSHDCPGAAEHLTVRVVDEARYAGGPCHTIKMILI
jgi:hypothetical protein